MRKPCDGRGACCICATNERRRHRRDVGRRSAPAFKGMTDEEVLARVTRVLTKHKVKVRLRSMARI